MAFCAHCGKELPVGANVCPNCGTPVQQASAPAAQVSGFDTLTKDQGAQSYWLKRLLAYVVDAIIVFVVFFALVAVLALVVTLPVLVTGGFAPFALVFGTLAFFGGIVFLLYFAVLESSRGTTIGKSAFGLKVVAKGGGHPTFVEALIRNVSKIYWLLLLLDVIVGLALSKGYQQKYSDQLMGTSVVPK